MERKNPPITESIRLSKYYMYEFLGSMNGLLEEAEFSSESHVEQNTGG